MATQKQVDDFYQFASKQVGNGGAGLTIDELYLTWRAHQPTEQELEASVAAINAAYADLLAGDEGEPARDSLRKTCRELGLVIDE